MIEEIEQQLYILATERAGWRGLTLHPVYATPETVEEEVAFFLKGHPEERMFEVKPMPNGFTVRRAFYPPTRKVKRQLRII